MTIDAYITRFENLRRNKSGGRERPHKICMLLSVLDLAKAGGLEENKIYLNPELVERYTGFFTAASKSEERLNPHYPFFYLRGKLANKESSFWHLHPIRGRESLIDTLEVTKASDVSNNIEYASLDSELFDLLQNLENIERLEEALTRYWFDRSHTDLRSIVKASGAISHYERHIRRGELAILPSDEADSVRSPAFRRVVTQIYDYRCAATGVRILLPTGEAMVEAAHIHPFSEAGDDDPRNGLALTPNIHWAMDRNLIAPGPDRVWHVSKVLDKRVPDYQMLTSLQGMPLFLPTELRFSPKEESLVWRLERLRE
jgi:putative restriction endonuclease